MATQLTGPVMPIRTVSAKTQLVLTTLRLVNITVISFTLNCLDPLVPFDLLTVSLESEQSDDDKSPESLYFFDETFEPFF